MLCRLAGLSTDCARLRCGDAHLVHGAARRAECRRLTPEEMAKLPPNMRRVWPRGRGPVYVELDVGNQIGYRASLAPTGIAGDGPSGVYERFVVPAGQCDVNARMCYTAWSEGFDFERTEKIVLAPDQMFVIDFCPEPRGFVSSDRAKGRGRSLVERERPVIRRHYPKSSRP